MKKDLTGQRFERLVVESLNKIVSKFKYWNCVCDCGNKTVVKDVCLVYGNTKSCGCLQKEKASKHAKTKPGYRTGKRKCKRCKLVFTNEKNQQFHLLCEKCRISCSRCNKEFSEQDKTSKRDSYCLKCKNEIAKIVRDNRPLARKLKLRDYNLTRKYGITLIEYEDILLNQNGVCYICVKPSVGRMLSVDHKHVLKDRQQNPRDTRTRVRGLLCWQCNGAIAKFRDDPVRLRRAADYLEQWPAQSILKEQV